jgi:hypothetical protein
MRVWSQPCCRFSVATFGADAAFDEFDEVIRRFDGLALLAGPALAQDGDQVHAELAEILIDRRFAIAPIGGDGVGHDPDRGDSSLDRRHEPGCIRGHAGLELVVDDHALTVVGDLRGVAELGRFARLPLRIGRASSSTSDTRRVLPGGVSPASRSRV